MGHIKHIFTLPITLIFSLLSFSCAHESVNRTISHIDPEEHTAPIRSLVGHNSDDLVLVLAFSGGGTRAASLAFGVLEALDGIALKPDPQTEDPRTMLDEIDSISSVSGGSFTGAYYALHGRAIFSEFPERMFSHKLGARLALRLMYPWNWFRLGSIYFSRSDLAAELYDDLIFQGATFKDIREYGYANIALQATDLVSGTRFSFTPDFFTRLCLDLMDYPIARAVTASSAFPGPFAPILLKNAAGTCGYKEEEWIKEALRKKDLSTRAYSLARVYDNYQNPKKKKYVHLVDGGISDNLGIRGPLEAVMTRGGFLSFMKEAVLPENLKVAFIIVNAETSTPKTMSLEYVMPSMLQMIDASSTVMINRYNFETVALLRSSLKEWAAECQNSKIKGAPKPQFYFSQVSFDSLQDDKEKDYLSSIPTALGLPHKDIDRLRKAAREILYTSPDFVRLIKDMGGTIPQELPVTAQAQP